MKPSPGTLTIGLLAALVAVLIDQVSKARIVENADALSSGRAVLPGFNLVFRRNDGVTFGLLREAPWWSLSALATAICVWLAVLLFRTASRVEALA